MITESTPVLSVDRLIVTPHCISRALKMRGLEDSEVTNALFSPESVTYSIKHASWNFVSGRVCCGVYVAPDGLATVLTVLWRSDEDWKKDMEIGEYDGRKYRG